MGEKFPYLRIEVTDDGQVRRLGYRRTVLDPDCRKAVLGPVAGANIAVVQTNTGENEIRQEWTRILFADGTRADVRISKLDLWFHKKQLQEEVDRFKRLAGPTLFESAIARELDKIDRNLNRKNQI